ncbi:unnamed protein product [Allacma fusca]|uniref:Uncharacterized protein n=1 Tax=Allacma fusca TaxID=39272 RepID=A0A8J2KGA3_9HEXA|nr:unnamed protein product [Allacma fusca]
MKTSPKVEKFNQFELLSGVVETYDLKDKLLTEILPLMKEAEVDKTLSTSDRNMRARDKAAGEEIRMAAMSSMVSKVSQQKSISNNPDEEVMESNVTPKLKRRKDDILELIRVKELAAQKTREEELCIKREKLEILKLEENSQNAREK